MSYLKLSVLLLIAATRNGTQAIEIEKRMGPSKPEKLQISTFWIKILLKKLKILSRITW